MMRPPPIRSRFHARLVFGIAGRRLEFVSRELLRPPRLFKVFLVGLLIVLGLGLSGGVHSALEGFGAGQTGLAYSLAESVNGGRLRPVQNNQIYRLYQTTETAIQNYFFLDQVTGSLRLRDGLKTIDTGANPLQGFPLRIAKLDPKTGLDSQAPEDARNLYIHVVNCPSYLQLLQAGQPPSLQAGQPPTDKIKNPLRELDPARQVVLCAAEKPFFGRGSTVEKVYQWLDRKAEASAEDLSSVHLLDKSNPVAEKVAMLPLQKDLLMSDLVDVYALPPVVLPPDKESQQSTRSLVVAGKLSFEGGSESIKEYLKRNQVAGKPTSIGAQAVTEIVLFVDRADPGMEIFRFLGSTQNEARNLEPDPLNGNSSPSDWDEDFFVFKEQVLLWGLRVRVPVLVVFGLVFPFGLYLIRYRYILVRCFLKPYVLLLFSQVATMVVATWLIGEGFALWVGWAYTLMRVLQVWGMLRYLRKLEYARMLHVVQVCGLMQWLTGLGFAGMASTAASRLAFFFQVSRVGGGVRPWWLRPLLWFEFSLWSLNAVGLSLHFCMVFSRFSSLSPA